MVCSEFKFFSFMLEIGGYFLGDVGVAGENSLIFLEELRV